MIYNYDQTIELLQRAVTEKGDGHTTANRYTYLDGIQQHCIVGQVLSYVGLLKYTDGHQLMGVRDLGLAGRKLVTFHALDALAAAQKVTDEGKTWGEALIAAKEVGP